MGQYIEEFKVLEIDPGYEGDIILFTVPPGSKLTNVKLILYFVRDTNFMLEVYVKYGNMKILPEQGVYSGENMRVEINIPVTYQAQENVVIHVKNKDTTNAKKLACHLKGELI